MISLYQILYLTLNFVINIYVGRITSISRTFVGHNCQEPKHFCKHFFPNIIFKSNYVYIVVLLTGKPTDVFLFF